MWLVEGRFEVERGSIAEGGVEAAGVIEALDVEEDGAVGVGRVGAHSFGVGLDAREALQRWQSYRASSSAASASAYHFAQSTRAAFALVPSAESSRFPFGYIA